MLHVILFLSTYLSCFYLALTRAPVFAFILYQTVYFYHPSGRWWGDMIPSLSYSFYTVVLMMVAFLSQYKNHQRNKLFSAPQIKWMYLILLGYGFTSFWAVLPIPHQDAFINFLKLVVTMSIAYKLIDTSKKLDFVIWGYIWGCWYVSFLIFQTGRTVGNRVEGIGTIDSPDANGIAAAIAPSLVFCVYYFWTKTGKINKSIFAVAGVFIANAIILINSRGAILAVALCLIYFMTYMLFSRYKIRFQKLIATSLIILGLGGGTYLIDDSFIARVSTIFIKTQEKTIESASTRTIFWASAWEMTKDYPLGLGFQGFNYYSPMYIPKDVNTGRSRNRTVHSTWFEALTELGYYGLFCLIAMLYSSYWSTKQCRIFLLRDNDLINYYKIIAIEASLLSFLIAMTFLNRFRAETLYWLVLFTACAYNIYVIKPKSENKD